ncbi:MAG: SDR family oxidoreductase [Actinobacteria bacterium]|nr:SDR family oxidoreductase [Actinomycetota bacterium]
MERPVAVMMGGTGGLGIEVGRRLAERRFRLAVSYLVPDQADKFEEILRIPEDDLLLKRCNATERQPVDEFMASVAERFGGINVLVNLVGRWSGGSDVEETDDVRFDHILEVNLRSAFLACRAALPYLRQAEWGRIILIGSRSAVDPAPGQAAYNVAKAGVIALAGTIAQEVNDAPVTANVVLPSVIDTPAFREVVPFGDYVNWPTPGEIASVIDFLASPESAVINGAMIPVYGKM